MNFSSENEHYSTRNAYTWKISGLSTHKFFSTDSYTIKKTYTLDLYQENKLKMCTNLTLKVIKAAGYEEQAVSSLGPVCQHTSTSQAVWRDTQGLSYFLIFSSHVVHAAYCVIYNSLH
jgi:hypothetical protein